MRRKHLRAVAFIVTSAAVALLSTPARSAPDEPRTARYYRQQAAAAYKAKDYASAFENFKKALEIIPDHPTLLYNLGAMSVLQGKNAEAFRFLSRVAGMGLALHPERDADFASVKDTPEFAAILKSFEANKTPIIHSSTAFSIREKGLITEGLAYDPVTETFFVSSVHKRKILSVGKSGDVKTLASQKDGLWSVLGMKVDAGRRHLWVTSSAFPQMVDFQKEENGNSAVFKFDLTTGKLIKRYPLNNDKPHALGDLIVSSNGDVYATDSLSPAVYIIRAKQDAIELFLQSDRFVSPQGLAFSNDEQHLFMADYSMGLFDIDMKGKQVNRLAPIAGATLLGIDGLYFHKGSLIGVQNGITPWRLVRIHLSRDLKQTERLEVLEVNNPLFDEPTLGVIVKDNFYFIANSQWGLVDDKAQLGPAEKLVDPIILKLSL